MTGNDKFFFIYFGFLSSLSVLCFLFNNLHIDCRQCLTAFWKFFLVLEEYHAWNLLVEEFVYVEEVI